jgi:hypothetical protein
MQASNLLKPVSHVERFAVLCFGPRNHNSFHLLLLITLGVTSAIVTEAGRSS